MSQHGLDLAGFFCIVRMWKIKSRLCFLFDLSLVTIRNIMMSVLSLLEDEWWYIMRILKNHNSLHAVTFY